MHLGTQKMVNIGRVVNLQRWSTESLNSDNKEKRNSGPQKTVDFQIYMPLRNILHRMCRVLRLRLTNQKFFNLGFLSVKLTLFHTEGNMGVMICSGKRGLSSLSALSSLLIYLFIYLAFLYIYGDLCQIERNNPWHYSDQPVKLSRLHGKSKIAEDLTVCVTS